MQLLLAPKWRQNVWQQNKRIVCFSPGSQRISKRLALRTQKLEREGDFCFFVTLSKVIGKMLHEILLALMGHAGDIIVERDGRFELSPVVPFLHEVPSGRYGCS